MEKVKDPVDEYLRRYFIVLAVFSAAAALGLILGAWWVGG